MKRLFILLLTINLVIIPQLKVSANTKPSVNAEGAVLIDLNTGQILYEKNANRRFEPASTTKIITALLTLEKTKLDDKVIVGKQPPFEDGSKIYLLEGEELTVDQLLHALLLESANDAALALAEHIGGSKEGFAKMMNDKAKELGCKNTNFENPNGLPADNHYTTAYDLALITRKAMENPVFRQIVATKTYEIPPTNKQPLKRHFTNHNKLITTKTYAYEGADGVKTGYTIRAGHTYVGSATRGNQRLAVVLLRDDKNIYGDTQTLLNYGFSNFEYDQVVSKGDAVSKINISGNERQIPVYPSEDLYITTQKNQDLSIKKDIVLNKSFERIKKGDVIGYLNVSIGDADAKKIPLISGADYKSSLYTLKSDSSGSYKEKLKSKVVYLTIGSAFGLFLISGFYRAIKIKKEKSRYKNSRLYK